ncbi:hypothetical protein PF005_g30120 [Phytophthora fragariae]|uniref:HMG box domain-containing protein n=1 Tax=Phytophthora fragariae TaxID=53985 RepID=A0A6A3PRS3_9STRA|nr:hypothetical protein PF003_g23474 [Phytophthora fragariae]KAE8921326.1 hypothetical protein PF009_g28391 [Phytophthora fragariae]KAE8963976.1 hypothetical protein PF011_g28835 [Phytophthora fragariae]KAE9061839.1 hypothetical protein PF007_g30116 [Phytophthora fragariae]KAE9066901.1 hypothetical protein PF006_g30111 [Phytophthora fragariae]
MAPVKKSQRSYLLFCNERCKQVLDENPGAHIGNIRKVTSVQWKELKPEEKDVYMQPAATDKERYHQELLDNSQVDAELDKEVHDSISPIGRARQVVQSDADVDMSKMLKHAADCSVLTTMRRALSYRTQKL